MLKTLAGLGIDGEIFTTLLLVGLIVLFITVVINEPKHRDKE